VNPPARLAVLALAVLLLGGATALVLQSLQPGDGAAGAYPVRVTGPDGDLHNGTVAVHEATAYGALLAAADAAGLAVHTVEYPGYAPCGTYVERVGDHAAGGDGGWVYEVRRDGAWQRPPVGACAYPLQPGDEVWWRYVDGP